MTEIGWPPRVGFVGVSARVTVSTPLRIRCCAVNVCRIRVRALGEGSRWAVGLLDPQAVITTTATSATPAGAPLRTKPCSLTSVPNIALAWMARTRLAAFAAGCLIVIFSSAASALAARVEVLGPGGHVHVINNRFIPDTGQLPRPAAFSLPASDRTPTTRARAAPTPRWVTPPEVPLLTVTTGPNPLARIAATAKPTTTPVKSTKPTPTPKPKVPQVTVGSVLEKLELSGAITTAQYHSYLTAWNGALGEEQHLPTARKDQLSNETVILHDIAASGQLTASRLPVLFLTLQRNAQWWLHGAMLSYGQRVQFSGSNLVWEYYPGQGIQLQVLGTFGEADGYYEAGKSSYPQLEALMSEMIPLAVHRGGALTWEYYFNFDGGHPPWVSAMSQATGIEALANAYKATRQQSYLSLAHQALPLLTAAPPTGVGVRTARGWRFLQYSFAPKLDIINAFLQTLVGLDTYAQVSDDQTAQQLFTAGNAEAQWELPSFNTGSWSLYQPGEEDDLSYHELVTGFAQNLCTFTKAPVYCNTATAFQSDLKTPPTLTQLTQVAKSGEAFPLRFKLSKISKVGVVITGGGAKSHAKPVVYTSAQYPHGTDAIKVGKLKTGTYSVKMSATDLAGNYASLTGEVIVYKGTNRPTTPPPPTSTQTGPKTPTTTTTTPTKTTTTPTKTVTTPTRTVTTPAPPPPTTTTTTPTVTTPPTSPGSGGVGPGP